MLAELVRRIRYWLANSRSRAEVEEEMRLHIALRTERLEASGMGAAEAAVAAQRTFGSRIQLQEISRNMWIAASLDDLLRDLRFAIRNVVRNPGFTITAVLIIALGIGANTAIFQLVNALRLRMLPVRNPQATRFA